VTVAELVSVPLVPVTVIVYVFVGDPSGNPPPPHPLNPNIPSASTITNTRRSGVLSNFRRPGISSNNAGSAIGA
jgi:hypothetical protein